MIRRDVDAAAGRFDLAVVGGGIYGVSLVLEAARRGLRPLLIERGDFGAETSWNSLRIVHGGQRYLQNMDLQRFRESVTERSRWLREFPDLVRPLDCLMPLYGRGLRRPAVLRAALALNDALSARRNEGLRGDRSIDRGRVLDATETTRLFPGVDRHDLRGGALWHDGSMPDSQRVLIEMLHWAEAAGAVALNYVEARTLRQAGGRATGLIAEDRVGGRELEIEASAVVNCAGPWAPEVAARLDRPLPGLFPLSIAFNVLLDRPALSAAALAVEPKLPGARTYFLHPWKGRILAGTFHAPWSGSRESGAVDEALLGRLLAALNLAVPGWDLTRDDVLRVHWGFLPAKAEGVVELASRETIRHHGPLGGVAGLFSVCGVKFTTARRVAEKTLAAVQRWRGAALGPADTAGRPEPAAWIDREALAAMLELDENGAADRARELARTEAVVHLDDLMLRRTDWGVLPGSAELGRRVAGWFDWSEARRTGELARLVAASR